MGPIERPLLRLEIYEDLPGHLQNPEVGQLGGVGGIPTVEDVGVLEGQLDEVLVQLCGPASGSPGEGVALDELVEQVNSPHVPVVVTDDCRALHSYLIVVYSALSWCLLPLDNFFLHGLVAGDYHRHEPDPLPADDKHICFTTPHGFSSCKLLRVLSEPLEDSGCPTHQPKGTTAMDTCIVVPGPGIPSYSSCP